MTVGEEVAVRGDPLSLHLPPGLTRSRADFTRRDIPRQRHERLSTAARTEATLSNPLVS